MTLAAAQDAVRKCWGQIASHAFGGPAELDPSLTEEYDWGWVFCFVPQPPGPHKAVYPQRQYAYDRETEISVPVGTKGIEGALHYIAYQKERYHSGRATVPPASPDTNL